MDDSKIYKVTLAVAVAVIVAASTFLVVGGDPEEPALPGCTKYNTSSIQTNPSTLATSTCCR